MWNLESCVWRYPMLAVKCKNSFFMVWTTCPKLVSEHPLRYRGHQKCPSPPYLDPPFFIFLTVSHCLWNVLFFDVCLQWVIDECRGLLSALSQSQMNKGIDHLCFSERVRPEEKLPICPTDTMVLRDKKSSGLLKPQFKVDRELWN